MDFILQGRSAPGAQKLNMILHILGGLDRDEFQ
jgi:hypothetical protein